MNQECSYCGYCEKFKVDKKTGNATCSKYKIKRWFNAESCDSFNFSEWGNNNYAFQAEKITTGTIKDSEVFE